jgi:3-methyladenine DNA glycosylase Tag
MNLFLGQIVETICKKMNSYEYSYVDYGMFKQAIETFENIQTIELEKIRIIKNLEKIKAECDILIDDVERKFHK